MAVGSNRRLFNLMLNLGMEALGVHTDSCEQQADTTTDIASEAIPELQCAPPVVDFLQLAANTGGAVAFIVGERYVGKSTCAHRLAELLQRPTYAVSPDETPPAGITECTLQQIDSVPPFSTLILDDAQVYAGADNYRDPIVKKMNAIIPVVRKKRKLVMIFATQVSGLVNKHVLQADLTIFKPLTAHYEVLERGPIVKLGRISEQHFAGLSREQQQRHAVIFGRYPPWTGLVYIQRPRQLAAVLPEADKLPDISTRRKRHRQREEYEECAD